MPLTCRARLTVFKYANVYKLPLGGELLYSSLGLGCADLELEGLLFSLASILYARSYAATSKQDKVQVAELVSTTLQQLRDQVREFLAAGCGPKADSRHL